MAFSCVFRTKFRDATAVASLCRKLCTLNLPAASCAVQVRGGPLIDHTRGYRKKIDVSHLKPLNFDYAGDLKSQEPLDPSELVFKYKNIPEIKELPEHVQKVFTLGCASAMERLEHRHAVMLDDITKLIGPDDCIEKQICYLTVKIRNLVPTIVNDRRNKKHKSYLIEIIAKRKKMLRRLKRIDRDRFLWLLKHLQITYKEDPPYLYHRLGRKAQEKRDHDEKAHFVRHKKFAEVKAKLKTELIEYLEEKNEILQEIDEDIKSYNLDKEEVMESFKNLHKERRIAVKEAQKKLPKIERYRLEQKAKKLKESRVF